ncbi:hypothetical protein [Streptomyces sp. NPDC029004]
MSPVGASTRLRRAGQRPEGLLHGLVGHLGVVAAPTSRTASPHSSDPYVP